MTQNCLAETNQLKSIKLKAYLGLTFAARLMTSSLFPTQQTVERDEWLPELQSDPLKDCYRNNQLVIRSKNLDDGIVAPIFYTRKTKEVLEPNSQKLTIDFK